MDHGRFAVGNFGNVSCQMERLFCCCSKLAKSLVDQNNVRNSKNTKWKRKKSANATVTSPLTGWKGKSGVLPKVIRLFQKLLVWFARTICISNAKRKILAKYKTPLVWGINTFLWSLIYLCFLHQLTSFHVSPVIITIRIRNEILGSCGFLCSIIKFTHANGHNKINTLASVFLSADKRTLKSEFCHHRLIGVMV